MAVFNIDKMKVIAPSPDNFIINLQLVDASENSYNYNFIASGEHIYVNQDGSIDESLISDHVAHSSVFNLDGTTITAFSLFDMNDVGITTHDNNETDLYSLKHGNYNTDIIDNLLLMPNANVKPSDKVEYNIPMHTINSNAVYGYIATTDKSFGFPISSGAQIFSMSTHSTHDGTTTLGQTDTLSLYNYNEMATNVSNILGLGIQSDIDASMNFGFDKLFVFDPTDDNKLNYGEDNEGLIRWRKYQTNIQNGSNGVTNNFDNGTLLARAIIFPKQTLNNEYSTERTYIQENNDKTPFNYVRKYKWDEKHFYSNGLSIVLNHKDENKFTNYDFEDPTAGTMVSSIYSNRLGRKVKQHSSPQPPNTVDEKTDYNTYNTFSIENSQLEIRGVFNQYSPEIFNRTNETMSDTSLTTSQHKANVFDIKFSGLWRDICKKFTPTEGEEEAYNNIKANLKKSIKSNLYKLVEEIKPAQTELLKIEMED